MIFTGAVFFYHSKRVVEVDKGLYLERDPTSSATSSTARANDACGPITPSTCTHTHTLTLLLFRFLNSTVALVSPKTLNCKIEKLSTFNWIYIKKLIHYLKIKIRKKSIMIVYLLLNCLSLYLNIERVSAFRVVSGSLFHALEAR